MDNQQPSPKSCVKCGDEKPLSEFPVYHRNGRRRRVCNTCWNAYHKRWRDGEIKPIAKDAVSRVCRACGETKSTEDFAIAYAKNSRGVNYRKHTCAACARQRHAEQMRKFREEHGERYREYRREHRSHHLTKHRAQRRESGRRLKEECFGAYGGYRCVCCEEAHPSMLTLDHINEDGAQHRNLLNGGRGRNVSVDMYRRLKHAGYPEGFQVLCYNCNISKHRNAGTCAHKLGEGSTTIPSGSTAKRPEAHGAPRGR